MMADLEALMNDATFIGSVHEHEGKSFIVALADNFSYTDPIDASISSKQVIWNQSLSKMCLNIWFDRDCGSFFKTGRA